VSLQQAEAARPSRWLLRRQGTRCRSLLERTLLCPHWNAERKAAWMNPFPLNGLKNPREQTARSARSPRGRAAHREYRIAARNSRPPVQQCNRRTAGREFHSRGNGDGRKAGEKASQRLSALGRAKFQSSAVSLLGTFQSRARDFLGGRAFTRGTTR
jgi:hypothetical protein